MSKAVQMWNEAKFAELCTYSENLERDNAALRAALIDAEELERNTDPEGHRQWGRHGVWVYRDDVIVVLSANAYDAARAALAGEEAKP